MKYAAAVTQVEFAEMLPIVALVIEGAPMSAGSGLVYSTDPRTWHDANGTSYVVKGPDANVVVAEAVAYELAAEVNLSTPGYSIARKPDSSDVYFASHKLESCIREVAPWLDSPTEPIVQALSLMMAFDTWLANEDRNSGGLLAEPCDDGVVLRIIDFEKSLALRGTTPMMTVASADPRSLRPRGELLKLCDQARARPLKYVGAIEAVNDSRIEACVRKVKGRVPAFTWDDSVIACLAKRRDKLAQHIKGVWS